jgi:hypothetical protein
MQVVKGWRKWLNVPRRKKQAEREADDDELDDHEDHDTISNTRANAAATDPNPNQYEGYPGSEEDDSDEVPQRLPPDAFTDSSPDEEEEPNQRKRKKWFGVI